ncbi:diacylglycerol/lipid kinase family protein [Xinfangfangia pollutisoli]|uniref:diacylglycerol/lipid kinase family protein n=1 Tax=Xinfangfangia pollutisoli TaxID=2865960 RepID=UPI001CD394CB|nr:diacylglycerol kinase family protein [Xinfangfangia pollutisoli]
MQGPVIVLANAGSGRQQARIEHLAEPLAAAGLQPELRLIRHGHALQAEARRARDRAATVIAAGGDGTVTAVAEALLGSPAALGILPLGTFNFFARSLGLPPDPADAAQALIGGQVMAVPVGEVNGRLFLNNASLGLYPALIERREAAYARWGRSRVTAYWSALRLLCSYDRPSRLRITVDGRTTHVRSPMVFIAQNAFQLDQYGMAEGADLIRAGQLAIYVAPELRRWQLLGFALKMALRRARPYRDFTLEGGQDVLIETRSPRRSLARDGEREKMQAPFHFRHLPAALNVLVPAAEAARMAGTPVTAPGTAPGGLAA